MTKINLKLKTLKINEPMMLFWSVVPLLFLIITTNYIFNSNEKVLGTSVEDVSTEIVDTTVFENIKAKNQSFKWNKGGVVTLLFAGAYKEQFEVGYPLVKENNLVATISVPTSEVSVLSSKMTWLNLQLLQHQGWEVVSQSKDHICDVEKLKDPSVAESETLESKNELIKHNLYVNTYIAPCGIVTTELQTEVKNNYKSFVNFGIIYNPLPAVNKYNLVARTVSNEVNIDDVKNWINEANASGQWLILAIPNISDEDNNFSIKKENLESVLKEVSTSKIQNATIGDILKY